MNVIDIEPTPNPDALKFILDATVLDAGSRSYDTAAAAKDDTLAAALFAVKGVQSVFYMAQFVTVTKTSTTTWTDLQPSVINALKKSAAPTAAPASTNGTAKEKDQDALLERVNQVIDDSVRPALAGDGGGLEVIELKDFVLTIHYQGACGSCPSSTAGTMMAVQNLLQRMVDRRLRVVSV
jgi:Fe-S cluster biogenesis protein NfuA